MGESLPYARGRDTSKAAARSMEPHAPKLREQIFQYILKSSSSFAGLTCDEIERDMNLRHQTASARCHELLRAGRVRDIGLRRKTRSGRWAAVLVPVVGKWAQEKPGLKKPNAAQLEHLLREAMWILRASDEEERSIMARRIAEVLGE